MTKRLSRVACGTAVLVLLGGALGGSVVWGSPGSACPDRVFARGVWTGIRTPVEGSIESYAGDPSNEDEIAVSDGQTIWLTRDGGCRWSTVYGGVSSGDSPAGEVSSMTTPAPAIEQVVLAPSKEGSDHILAIDGSGSLAPTIEVTRSPTILISADRGDTWTRVTPDVSTLTTKLENLVVAPSDARVVYVKAYGVFTPTADDVVEITQGASSWGLLASEDGGLTWELRSAGRGELAQPAVDWEGSAITIDPGNPSSLWATGDALSHSSDGGRTWGLVEPQIRNVTDVAIGRFRNSRWLVVATPQFVGTSGDGGGTWKVLPGSPAGARSIEVGAQGEIVVLTETASKARDIYRFNGRSWALVSDPGAATFEGLSTQGGRRRSYLTLSTSRSDPDAYLNRYEPSTTTDIHIGRPGQIGQTESSGCPPPSVPLEWQSGWDPLPTDDVPVYVTNIETGNTVRFDRFGNGTVVAIAPTHSEGIALDPLGRILISTRTSGILARLDPSDCSIVVIDDKMAWAESPAFDDAGNLFVVGTQGQVFEYPWPQHPGQAKQLVHDFSPDTDAYGRRVPDYFLEDVRVAPQSSPFAGDLLVQYMDRGTTDIKATNRIARLTPRGQRWERADDFVRLADVISGEVNTAGMEFTPTGEVLIPNRRDGVIYEIAADGSSARPFARIAPRRQGPGDSIDAFKIDVTPAGFVYVTTGASGSVMRLSPDGDRLQPDLTHNLTYPIGIAVPRLFPELALPNGGPDKQVRTEKVLLNPPFDLPFRAAGLVVIQPLPPPPLPVIAPAAVHGPAPVSASAQAPATVANPQLGVVEQRQEQPQMALVRAVQQVQEKEAMQYAMVRRSAVRDSGLGLRYSGAIAMLAFAALLGWSRAGVPVRIRSSDHLNRRAGSNKN